jgi:hypothetical protein
LKRERTNHNLAQCTKDFYETRLQPNV